MPERNRVLFVDDEPEIRRMWSSILSAEGFQVKQASTVTEALATISAEEFDALITDLNIGQPGDGFTVVSAMRSVHPEAVTLILTGYPAFQAALRAIHEQVDDFLTKPADPEEVVKSIRGNLARRKKHAPVITHRLPRIIEAHKQKIIEDWYQAAEADPYMATVPLSRNERIDHLPDLLDEVVRQPTSEDDRIRPRAWDSAAKHGDTRRKQGYTVPMMLEETRLLHHVIAQYIQRHLLTIDISNLVPDLVTIDDTIHLMLRHSAEAFLQRKINAA